MQRLTEQQFIEKTTRNLETHIAANKVKDRLERLGYDYTMSLYGVIYNPETLRHEYRRIEVFLNVMPNQVNANEIRQFFREIKPYHYYSIWAYNAERHEIILVESWQ